MQNQTSVSAEYLQLLLQYYEEEVMGAAYFTALAEQVEAGAYRAQFELLADVERAAARSVAGLLDKYALTARPAAELAAHGEADATAHAGMTWRGYLRFMTDTFPDFVVQFERLEALAPAADKAALRRLTEHEVVTIEYARRALSDDRRGASVLFGYLHDAEPAPINRNHTIR